LRKLCQETLTKRPFKLSKLALIDARMKRRVLALAAVLILLFSTTTGLLLIKKGKANPLQELGSVPPDSTTKPPTVTIFSPINGSAYTTNFPTLSVNVTLPESSTALGTILYFVICQTDWQENETRLYQNTGYANSIESKIPLDEHHYFQGSLSFEDLPAGNHSITILAIAGVWYSGNSGDCGFYRFKINGSSTIFFTTGIQPTSSPEPTSTPQPTSTPSNEPQSRARDSLCIYSLDNLSIL
jgi:hypothetical protein